MQKMNLSPKNYKVLDQILAQIGGYPIESEEDKLGVPKKKIRDIFDRVRAISTLENPPALDLSHEELIQIARAVALVFIETGPNSDLHTVTGYSASDVEEMYEEINKLLRINR